MCGIIGYLGDKEVVPVLFDGLRRLEYRGYDSAGIALASRGRIEVRRSAGKLDQLEQAVRADPVTGDYGVGHTRWATHGRPTEENAHPHRDCTGRLVVVHNGIIENHRELKRRLQADGHRFETETDTEVVAHLVEHERRGDGLESAVRRALPQLRGLFGLVLIAADDPDKIIAVRNGPPLVVGMGEGEFIVASDIPAVLGHTRDVVFLGDQELAVITRTQVAFTDFAGSAVSKATQRIRWDPMLAEKAGHKHFMLKEIFEQPWAIQETLLGRMSEEQGEVRLGELDLSDDTLRAVDQVVILACGTSWIAGQVGKFLFEQIAGVRTDVDYGSEYRYRQPIADERTLALVITQSGETADTLASLREARSRGTPSIAICNVVGSMVTRVADAALYTHAGPEIGVASTKAFTSQLVALILLALHVGRVRGTVDHRRRAAAHRGADPVARPRPAHARVRCRRRLHCEALLPAHRLPLSRPRHQLPHRARRGAQAEGNLLHSRGGVSGRRAEARPDRAHRREPAGRGAGAGRTGVPQDDEQPGGSEGPWRHRDRRHRHRSAGILRSARSRTGRRGADSGRRAAPLANPVCGPAAAPRVPHRGAAAAAT